MKTEIYNVEGIEIEVERSSKDDTEAERRKMAYAFKMIREQSGMNRKDFSDWLGIPYRTMQEWELDHNNYKESGMYAKEQAEVQTVPIQCKVALTIKEAAEYSNIGINKLENLLRSPRCPFVLYVGKKKLVKRKEFEKFISDNVEI